MDIIKPRDEDEVLAAVQSALLSETPLEIVGHGSKRGLGHAVEAAAQLDLSALSGVDLYEPTELVLRAKPATPLDEIAALLEANNQELAFEPMNPSRLWRGNRTGTLGGAVAVNASGPRRIKAGAARDHVLGFRAVSGRGDIFKSGGQVMKNVTGYDLSKLMAGSHGTLAVMTEVTVKVLPKAETERTFLMFGLDEAGACAALREASGLSYEMSSYACLPNGTWADLAPGCCLALRLEGPAVSVDKRFEELLRISVRAGASTISARPPRAGCGRRCATPSRSRMRPGRCGASTTPSEGPAFVAALRGAGVPVSRWYYDWAGGLIWLVLEGAEPHAATLRETLARHGGHATLVRADDAIRTATPVFQPQPAALAALSRRIKASFDPVGILNRGRMG